MRPWKYFALMAVICYFAFCDLSMESSAEIDGLRDYNRQLNSQLNQLGDFILSEFPKEPGKGAGPSGEGAAECAIRLLKKAKTRQRRA